MALKFKKNLRREQVMDTSVKKRRSKDYERYIVEQFDSLGNFFPDAKFWEKPDFIGKNGVRYQLKGYRGTILTPQFEYIPVADKSRTRDRLKNLFLAIHWWLENEASQSLLFYLEEDKLLEVSIGHFKRLVDTQRKSEQWFTLTQSSKGLTQIKLKTVGTALGNTPIKFDRKEGEIKVYKL